MRISWPSVNNTQLVTLEMFKTVIDFILSQHYSYVEAGSRQSRVQVENNHYNLVNTNLHLAFEEQISLDCWINDITV